MIKIAIKHFIYEKCISIFFDFIDRNFRNLKVIKYTADMFHKGDKYKYIKRYVDDTSSILYNCNVNKVFSNNVIEITYDGCTYYDTTINRTDTYNYIEKRCAHILCNTIIETSDD